MHRENLWSQAASDRRRSRASSSSRELAVWLSPFRCRSLVHDRFLHADAIGSAGDEPVTWFAVLPQAGIVTLPSRSTPRTKRAIACRLPGAHDTRGGRNPTGSRRIDRYGRARVRNACGANRFGSARRRRTRIDSRRLVQRGVRFEQSYCGTENKTAKKIRQNWDRHEDHVRDHSYWGWPWMREPSRRSRTSSGTVGSTKRRWSARPSSVASRAHRDAKAKTCSQRQCVHRMDGGRWHSQRQWLRYDG